MGITIHSPARYTCFAFYSSNDIFCLITEHRVWLARQKELQWGEQKNFIQLLVYKRSCLATKNALNIVYVCLQYSNCKNLKPVGLHSYVQDDNHFKTNFNLALHHSYGTQQEDNHQSSPKAHLDIFFQKCTRHQHTNTYSQPAHRHTTRSVNLMSVCLKQHTQRYQCTRSYSGTESKMTSLNF